VSTITDEVRQGTRQSDREKDMFTQSLGDKEHPGYTRGVGLIPCNLEFEAESSSY